MRVVKKGVAVSGGATGCIFAATCIGSSDWPLAMLVVGKDVDVDSQELIAVKAIAIVTRPDGALLVGESVDPTDGRLFQRPLGGSVEFGERALEAIDREMREEVGCELIGPALLGVLENFFTFNGQPGHEVLFVFEGELANEKLYSREEIECLDEDERSLGGRIIWRNLKADGPQIVPSSLLRLVAHLAM